MDITYKNIERVLSYCKLTHIALKNQVNFGIEDKKHALYLLQGGAISVTSSALAFNYRGLMLPRAQQKRMLDEVMDLILFFIELTDNSRQLKAWFRGHVVEREPGNRGNMSAEDRAKIFFFTTDQIKMLDKLIKQMNNELSKFMHPTIQAVRANSSKSRHIFDYDHIRTSNQCWEPQVFGELFIVPCINCLLIPSRELTPSQETFDLLRSYSLGIQGQV